MIRRRSFELAAIACFGVVTAAYGQTSCSTSTTTPTIHAEGWSERLGSIAITCTGGTGGSVLTPTLYFTLNTNLTNKLDQNGNTQNVVFSTGQPANVAVQSMQYSQSTVRINLTYTVPAGGAPVSFTVQGLRGAPAQLGNGTGSPVITVTMVAVGLTFPGAGIPFPIGIGGTTLTSSSINTGIPCLGSPLPDTLDFPTFATTSVSSSIRITEGSVNGFSPKETGTGAGSDTGTRIMVKVANYGTNARVFVPDTIVGISGSAPTSAGGYGTTVSGGTYTPGSNQLLLSRVSGADSNGVGGTLVTTVPGVQTSYSTVSEVPLTGGAGYVFYEVLDGNPNRIESAQVPVFLVVPQVACGAPIQPPSLSVSLAPLSTVSIGTATDPIPRFISTTIGSDCQQNGDCSASYFPILSVDTTPIQINGSAQGGTRSASLQVSNGGGGVMPFKVSFAYQTGTNWLSVSPTAGQNNTVVVLTANPANLSQGTYSATVTVDAGSFGTAAVVVNFVVGAPGVRITGVVNAASFKSGLVSPGSYAAVFGTNMGGSNVSVTFNGFPATIVYASATQINLIVPAALGFAPAADVVVTADAGRSDSVKVTVQPNAPGIFNPGIVNFADGATNDASHPAARGAFILVFATGFTIPLTGQVTVNIGNQSNLVPAYAGAQGAYAALDQINITVPAGLPATPNPVPLTLCIPDSLGTPVCSNAVNLYIK